MDLRAEIHSAIEKIFCPSFDSTGWNNLYKNVLEDSNLDQACMREFTIVKLYYIIK